MDSTFLFKIKPTLPEKPPRGSIVTGYQIFQQQFAFAVLIALGFIFGAFDLKSLGASETVHPLLAMLIGFLIYFPVLGLIEFTAYLTGLREKYQDLSFPDDAEHLAKIQRRENHRSNCCLCDEPIY